MNNQNEPSSFPVADDKLAICFSRTKKGALQTVL